MSGEGTGPAMGRNAPKHHAYSDQDEDPALPRHGGVWAHIKWMMPQYGRKYHDELYQRYTPDP